MDLNMPHILCNCVQRLTRCFHIFPHVSSVISSPSMRVCSGYCFETYIAHARCMFALPHVSDHVTPLQKWRTLLLWARPGITWHSDIGPCSSECSSAKGPCNLTNQGNETPREWNHDKPGMGNLQLRNLAVVSAVVTFAHLTAGVDHII